MTKILKLEEFINEQIVNEMGMSVRNTNIQQRMPDLLKKYNLVYNEATGLYDCDGDIKVEQDLVSPDGKLVINFGVVKGDFNCKDNKLTSLEGSPQEVGGDFDCSYNKLTSLAAAPQEVKGNFFCYNNKLTSLEGAPQVVGGDFNCINNFLTSLEGAPQEVSGYFNCNGNQLTSLEGAPQKVGDYFYCSINQLTSIKGAPQEVGGSFCCGYNRIVFDETNFYRCLPDVIGGELGAGSGCDYELAKDYYNNK